MKASTIDDSVHQLDHFDGLVHSLQDTAKGLQEKLLRSDETALVGLRGGTEDLLMEITRLVTIAPTEIHTQLSDQFYEDMHRNIATALTETTSTRLEAAGAVGSRESVAASIEFAASILERLSTSDVEQAKALYIARTGATRL